MGSTGICSRLPLNGAAGIAALLYGDLRKKNVRNPAVEVIVVVG
jgi:hypothetical protein